MARPTPTGRRRPAPARAGGFSYLALLFAVALIGTALGVAGQVWHFQMQREKEAQLIWVGHQYRQAIERYWKAGGGRGGGPGGPAGVSVSNGVVSGAAGPVAGLPGTGTTGVASPDVNALSAGQTAGVPGLVTPGVNGVAGTGGVAGVPGAGGNGRFPARLEDLLTDPRFQQVRHYLRKLYADPVTGKADWVPILAPGGGIMGVRSASEDKPVKQDNFSPPDIAFTGQPRYTDWAFVYVPPAANRRPASNSGYVNPPATSTGPAPGLSQNPAN